MSKWTHAACKLCYAVLYPDRDPVHVLNTKETCCFCGVSTTAGIYVRENPDSKILKCAGVHAE